MNYSFDSRRPEQAGDIIVLGERDDSRAIIESLPTAGGDRQKFHYTRSLEKVDFKTVEAIIFSDPQLMEVNQELIEQAIIRGVRVKQLPVIAEQYLKIIPEKLAIAYRDYYQVIFSTIKPLKILRFLDLTISALLTIIAILPLLASVLYILIKDGRPAFFRQKRIGYGGRIFMLLKLRTYDDITDEKGQTETVSTRSGGRLRKFRLNEIPQIVNVLRGEMSLVGSRPDILKDYQKNMAAFPFYFSRFLILPGITGHAQANYGYCYTEEDFQRRLEYDLYYVKNRSVRLYLLILLKTIKTVFHGQGC